VKGLRWILALYLFVLMVAVTYPMGPSRAPQKLHYLNDIKPGHVDALVQDVAQNIVMFLPAGYLGILMVGRASAGAGAYLIVVLTCATLSFGIETMQHFFLPWRYSTWIDIVSNTVGGLAGSGVARLMAVPASAGARVDEVDDVRLWRTEDPPPTT
jgi:glycopeptide antibiotics resistance protein